MPGLPSAVDPNILPGVVRQNGYVVRDIDTAIAAWLSLGVGPWYVLRERRQAGLYRGQDCEVTVSVAFANSGDLQLELIQQHGDTPSIYTEFLDSGQEGYHQLAFWAPDFDATMSSVAAAGWPVVWSGGGEDGGTRYAYFEPPAGPATIIEIMELNPATEGMAKLVREAAAGWDGTDPVRAIG
ncbi:Glyoxalase/Bleomycin resistance protein/Dioxygenase superfamily protein [Frankia sp. EI5c]|uniref:VOC family protein n=1 Tax=Frankia sp. EI5c TaxID=683316 RepID=UPI0007C25766|nr:VOC family protein [Frankia sp. EI5c]OAA27146.1 Glyoxalase/Bleomycin resistance protein/Dioxygenase superfamily protein [Frankia sp. EI5c]